MRHSADVIQASRSAAVVVDLWAPWCGPCKTSGPFSKGDDETKGQVVFGQGHVDENPAISQAFKVQSIPPCSRLKDGASSTVSSVPARLAVRDFVETVAAGPTSSPRSTNSSPPATKITPLVLDIDPGHAVASSSWARSSCTPIGATRHWRYSKRIPEPPTRVASPRSRVVASRGQRCREQAHALLPRVKVEEEARQEYLDILELLGPDDPRTATYRRRLTSALF